MATDVAEELKFRLDIFEGPLDLLLYLLKRDELDIFDIPIEHITRQYMEYLNAMTMLDLNIAGEFVVMAATLLMIKSRMLLPEDERPEIEGEEDDPRWELVRQLIEYKKFKQAAAHLAALENWRANVFGRVENTPPPEPATGVELADVSIFELIAAFNQALKRARATDFDEIHAEVFTVADKIETILTTLRRQRQSAFASLFPADASRNEIVCTFLALLELIRLRQLRVAQKTDFGDIIIALQES